MYIFKKNILNLSRDNQLFDRYFRRSVQMNQSEILELVLSLHQQRIDDL